MSTSADDVPLATEGGGDPAVGRVVVGVDDSEQAAEVQRTVLPGAAATTLVELSEDADLLVVGSHGRTGLSRLMHVGSVAMACVNHAACPVVVVRIPSED